jgi:endonuclease YncB( thermonuclease family)
MSQKYLVVALLLFVSFKAGCSAVFEQQINELKGHVVSVHDGDTITLLDADKVQTKIRLYGIDAPEKKQPFGPKAKVALSELVFDKDVRVEVITPRDHYGRVIGKIYAGDIYINQVLVEQGAAWWYRQYAPTDVTLHDAEVKAKEGKLGLWSKAVHIPPWQWRKEERRSKREKDGACISSYGMESK